ncbi:F7A19.14 PROTEIN-RELATED [Salix purpurea]|uniref:F7A19.14 PROTEIN-RELATED n=1 Tax=Salix purpurea TaxID=77065 RepID=A0A9Q0WBV6_SALPP|nr:F7A19.14 PROTEIN-RELATED [Salix purpurea]
MSSPDPKTPEDAKPSFDDSSSKEAIESLTSTITLEETDQTNTPMTGNQEEEEEEEEGECGFCLFMKGGGCKDAFVAWEDCIKQVEEKNDDIVEKCFEVTSALKLCMEAHADYYEPILRAEKAAEQEAVKQLEKEKEEEAAAAAQKSESNEKEK